MRPVLVSIFLIGCPDYTLKGRYESGAGTPESTSDHDTGERLKDSGDPQEEDSGDSQEEDSGDPPAREICDGEDNDGDGDIDEGFPDTDGDGIVDCLEIMHEVLLTITVDDVWEGWVDGASFAEEHAGWSHLDEFSFSLDSGPHIIAIHGWDTGRAISGHISSVAIDGVVTTVTGDGSWRVKANDAPEGWQDLGFIDTDWIIPVACTDLSPWGSWTGSPMDHGAVWTWYQGSGNCRDESSYGDAYFRLSLSLP